MPEVEQVTISGTRQKSTRIAIATKIEANEPQEFSEINQYKLPQYCRPPRGID